VLLAKLDGVITSVGPHFSMGNRIKPDIEKHGTPQEWIDNILIATTANTIRNNVNSFMFAFSFACVVIVQA